MVLSKLFCAIGPLVPLTPDQKWRNLVCDELLRGDNFLSVSKYSKLFPLIFSCTPSFQSDRMTFPGEGGRGNVPNAIALTTHSVTTGQMPFERAHAIKTPKRYVHQNHDHLIHKVWWLYDMYIVYCTWHTFISTAIETDIVGYYQGGYFCLHDVLFSKLWQLIWSTICNVWVDFIGSPGSSCLLDLVNLSAQVGTWKVKNSSFLGSCGA